MYQSHSYVLAPTRSWLRCIHRRSSSNSFVLGHIVLGKSHMAAFRWRIAAKRRARAAILLAISPTHISVLSEKQAQPAISTRQGVPDLRARATANCSPAAVPIGLSLSPTLLTVVLTSKVALRAMTPCHRTCQENCHQTVQAWDACEGQEMRIPVHRIRSMRFAPENRVSKPV